MPKRKRTNSNELQVLTEKDIKKIHKLVSESRQEDKDESNLLHSIKPEKLVLLDENEIQYDFKDICYDEEDNGETKEEWNKFFHASDTNAELNLDFKNKLIECKDMVNDEISEYCGSIPGELEGIDNFQELPPELKNHIQLLKSVLRNYRSGPLPKTVKVLPSLPGWDGLLEMLDPMSWTKHAHMKMSKVFASKGHEPSLYYYENYLFPKVQEDIAENKRLSMHLFEALINAMFRPQEFVAGIFMPWIRSDMTKTEGIVLAHLLKKASLKVRYGAVCLALACKEAYSIPRSLVIESLIEKKYTLPETVVAVLVQYFTSLDRECSEYYNDEGRLPVSWFKSLSLFLELYRDAVIPSEREQLVKLCRRHVHPFFTNQIRAFIQLIPTEHKI